MALGSTNMAVDEAHHRAIEQLVYATWWNTDLQDGEKGELYFCEDATVMMPARTMQGRAQIVEGSKARLARGPRLARHLVNNLLVEKRSETTMVAKYALLLFAKDGLAPMYVDGFSALADVTDECVLCGEGWLISRRELRTIFLAPGNDSVMLIRPPLEDGSR